MAVRPTGSDPTDAWMMLTGTELHEEADTDAAEAERTQEPATELANPPPGMASEPPFLMPQVVLTQQLTREGPPQQAIGAASPPVPNNTPERRHSPPPEEADSQPPAPFNTDSTPIGRDVRCWDRFLSWICCKRKVE